MTTPTDTRTALARRFRLDINTATSPAISWNQLLGVFDFKPNIPANLVDDDSYDDDGGPRKAVTAYDWTLEVKIYVRYDVSGNILDTQQKFLHDQYIAGTLGSDAFLGEFGSRWYDRDGRETGEAFQGRTIVANWVEDSTDRKDTQKVTVTIQGQGALEQITNPNANMDPVVTSVSDATLAAAGGEQEIVYGYHFTGATAVKFGATNAADFEVLSDSVIAAVTPAHAAGTVNVTVVTPEGTSATGAANQVVYA